MVSESMAHVTRGCKSIPVVDFSALKPVFVQHFSHSCLLPLEAGLGAVLLSPLGPGLRTLCSPWTEAMFKKPCAVDSCCRGAALGHP